jgi:hypothetical protein
MNQPVRDKLVGILQDATLSKEERLRVGDILEWYAAFDMPSESDKEIVGRIREFRASCILEGLSVLTKTSEGKWSLSHKPREETSWS